MSVNESLTGQIKKPTKIGQPITNESFLNKGEQVLWEGKPADFKTISPQSRREIIWKWVLLPLIFLVLILLHIKFNDSPNSIMIFGVILLASALAASVFLKKRKIMKCRYALTNERVVMVNSDYAYYIRFEDFDGFRVVRGQTENPTVLFGSNIYKDIDKHLLWRAASDISTERTDGDEASCYNLVFYNTVNAESLIEKLHELGIKEN